MEIKKCFEILELDPNASIDEAKQAYKDIVNVWHPDRFSHNSRLKEKAEKKLKEVNVAYETVISSLHSKKALRPKPDQAPPAKTATDQKTEAQTKPASGSAHQNFQGEAKAEDKTEAVAETGTRMFLEVCSFLYSSLRRIIDKQVLNPDPKNEAGPKGLHQNQRQDRSRVGGMGRGMGRQRGKGRGAGRGRGRR
jgi:curved DNA-binding protein CbpA